jgi:hypothetical protein
MTLLALVVERPWEQNLSILDTSEIVEALIQAILRPCHTIAYERNVWEAY